jgi:hypothetical protein
VFPNALPELHDHRVCAARGWSLKGITCAGANSSVDLPGRSATIDLAIGQNAECIFDNVASAAVTINALGRRHDTFAFDAREVSRILHDDAGSTKAGNTFDPVPPGNVTFVGLGAQGWQLDNVSCFGSTRGVDWVITGATTTIALAEGDSTECIYYYRLPSGIVVPPLPPAETISIPALDPRMLLLLVLLVGACVSWVRRRG